MPSVGPVVDRKREQDPAWKPLFDAYVPVREWLAKLKPDVAIVVYNDHVAEFSFDKYPTFALGAADRYAIADEGFGTRPLPEVPGDAEFSIHLCEQLIARGVRPHRLPGDGRRARLPRADEPVLPAQRRDGLAGEERAAAGERGPASAADGAPVFQPGQALAPCSGKLSRRLKVVILGTGGMSHQLQGKRFGFMNEKFDQWFLDQLEADPEALAGLSHHKIMEEAGAEAVELIMWLTMRGALSPKAKRVHRHYYAPMTTGMGLITFED